MSRIHPLYKHCIRYHQYTYLGQTHVLSIDLGGNYIKSAVMRRQRQTRRRGGGGGKSPVHARSNH